MKRVGNCKRRRISTGNFMYLCQICDVEIEMPQIATHWMLEHGRDIRSLPNSTVVVQIPESLQNVYDQFYDESQQNHEPSFSGSIFREDGSSTFNHQKHHSHFRIKPEMDHQGLTSMDVWEKESNESESDSGVSLSSSAGFTDFSVDSILGQRTNSQSAGSFYSSRFPESSQNPLESTPGIFPTEKRRKTDKSRRRRRKVRLVCEFCREKFLKPSLLVRHQIQHHKIMVSCETRWCPQCGQKFSNSTSLNHHKILFEHKPHFQSHNNIKPCPL